MDIKLPNSNTKKRYPSAPKAGLPKLRKPACLRPFSARSLGQCWPGHWPGQPGPTVGQHGPFLSPPGTAPAPPDAALGQPLSIDQVAELIGCSPWTVRQTLIPRGLPHFRFKANGRLIFYRDQVIRWIEKQQGGKQ